MRRSAPLALATLLVGGCSYAWIGDDPLVPETGAPTSTSSLIRLNEVPAGPATVLHGADGSPWAAFCEYRSGTLRTGSFRGCQRLHLSRLEGARADEIWPGDSFVVRDRAIYAIVDDKRAAQRRITVHRPGDPPGLDATFTAAAGPGLLYSCEGGDNDVFAYWVLDAATTRWNVWRRDGRHALTLPVPAGVDPTAPGDFMDFVFTAEGDRLVVSDPRHVVTVRSTLDDTALPLGVFPGAIFVDDPRRALVVVGAVLRSVALDGSGTKVLAPLDIDPSTIGIDGAGNAWFERGGILYRVPLDGSAPPVEVVEGAARLLAVGPAGQAIYSRDPAGRFINDAGDGWLGEQRFLERGFFGGFSLDATRLYVIEHAATTNAVGVLQSVPVGGGDPRLLARNVGRLDGLLDGRLLAVENQAQAGSWNRLVLVDEEAGARAALLEGTADFEVVRPGEREVLADVVSGASGYDILRVPLPARMR